MPSKSRGGLSKREYAAKQGTILKGKSSKVMDTKSAKKAASSSVSKEAKALASAQKEYLESLNPSAEETAATSSLGKINQEAEQQATRIRDPRQNTVATPFVERQTEALSNQTEQRVIPLKYQIAALQSQREARGNIAASKAKFATESYNRKISAISAASKEAEKQIKKTGGKKQLTPAQELAKSNSDYNKRKADDAQRGFVTLPKGVSGPPAPKVLLQKSKKRGR